MVKIKYEHFYGSQEKHDLQLVHLTLDPETAEAEALENGWLISNKKWYACRSVRINVDKYEPRKELPKSISYYFTTNNLAPVNQIYQKYRAYKGFEEEFDLFTDPERSVWLILEDDKVPVAFTKFITYNGGIESQFTCWNYHKPKMSLGKSIVNVEVKYAINNALNHLYIGQGYEKGSVYKAEFPGFEWWTGSEWSTDKEEYKRLCVRDSDINTIDDLSKIHNGK